MGKPAARPTWTGTSGNDVKVVADLTELKNTVYNAGSGYDTLDLSALTSGVSLQLYQGTQGKNAVYNSNLWADSPFHGGAYGWDQFSQIGAKTVDSILNFEKVIGT